MSSKRLGRYVSDSPTRGWQLPCSSELDHEYPLLICYQDLHVDDPSFTLSDEAGRNALPITWVFLETRGMLYIESRRRIEKESFPTLLNRTFPEEARTIYHCRSSSQTVIFPLFSHTMIYPSLSDAFPRARQSLGKALHVTSLTPSSSRPKRLNHPILGCRPGRYKFGNALCTWQPWGLWQTQL